MNPESLSNEGLRGVGYRVLPGMRNRIQFIFGVGACESLYRWIQAAGMERIMGVMTVTGGYFSTESET